VLLRAALHGPIRRRLIANLKVIPMRARFFLSALVVLSAPAVAQAASLEYANCRQRAAGNTVQLNICIQQELAHQDARLNKAYGELAHQLAGQPEKRARLKAEELSWLHERDYSCKVDATTTASDCVLTKTEQRANQLESRLRF
jgi:uncharacterized protein YecT (DUF1311 family)